jgi:hypothetical protein
MAALPAPPIRSVCPDVSAAFERVVDKGLQFRREDRYASAAEMADDVRRALGELEGARTRKAPGALAARGPSEASIEIQDADIVRSQYGLDASIRIPKNRSIVPWLLLLAVGGVGTKVWLDRRAHGPAPTAPAPSEVASTTAPAPAPIEAGAAAASAAVASALSASPLVNATNAKPAAGAAASRLPAPAVAPSSSAPHHATPKKRTPASLLKRGH